MTSVLTKRYKDYIWYNAIPCISEWEDSKNNGGLLFYKCPKCNGYIYCRNKSSLVGTFLYETGYYQRTVYFKCKCGQYVCHGG